MPLVECKECGREVSKFAKTCPYCGVPNPAFQIRTGCIVSIVVVFVVCSGLIKTSNKNSGPPPKTESGQSSSSDRQEGGGENGTTKSIGEPFILGDLRYKVVDAEQVSEIGNQLIGGTESSADAAFLIISYEIENMSNETKTVFTSNFHLNDGKGREFSPSTDAEVAMLMSGSSNEQDFILDQLHPGITKEKKQAFELPDEALENPGLQLVVTDKGLLSSDKVVIPLD
mgnify:CR=1 FL=1